MSHRTQITLTDEQYERLRTESARTGIGLAELVRRAVDRSYGSTQHATLMQALDDSFGCWTDRAVDAIDRVRGSRSVLRDIPRSTVGRDKWSYDGDANVHRGRPGASVSRRSSVASGPLTIRAAVDQRGHDHGGVDDQSHRRSWLWCAPGSGKREAAGRLAGAFPGASDEYLRIGTPRQLLELRAQVLLQRPSAEAGACREFVADVLWNVSDGDRRHAVIVHAARAICRRSGRPHRVLRPRRLRAHPTAPWTPMPSHPRGRHDQPNADPTHRAVADAAGSSQRRRGSVS